MKKLKKRCDGLADIKKYDCVVAEEKTAEIREKII